MQKDLQGLEITKGEVKRLSGLSVNAVFKPASPRKFLAEILKTVGLLGILSVSCIFLVQVFPVHRLLLIIVHLLLAVWLVIDDAIKIYLSQKHRHFIGIIEDVERFNAVIQSIDINDQIEAAGNPGVRLQQRERVIQALKLTREDLIRALKTERILRENEHFIKLNPELFANNLNALAALQVGEKASEYGRLLNEAFEIGMSIQDEMRQLQNRQL
ncbi:MAG TPA: hypothetical protein DDW76_05120 [Cyanobacteria bacterium UBA11369]|nr:hypothetical protein [Cyanobacteria bacterium UBA11371]HBE31779.1 hypothetical protein [Cyanobacteria bacterium UBA11368]HBE48188.1 hypothetical protein [Cyanobacteria bacterium UBA11369]